MSAPFNSNAGKVTGAGIAITVTTGYTPSRVYVVNYTTETEIDKNSGMDTTETYTRDVTGAGSIDLGSNIVMEQNGFTIAAAVCGVGDVINYWSCR